MTGIDIEALRARYEGHYHKTASADVLALLTELAAARAELAGAWYAGALAGGMAAGRGEDIEPNPYRKEDAK